MFLINDYNLNFAPKSRKKDITSLFLTRDDIFPPFYIETYFLLNEFDMARTYVSEVL